MVRKRCGDATTSDALSCGDKRQMSRRGACHETCYSVLQSTTPYHKALLQYYSALQSTTPYYKVLLESTTPVPLFTTKCNSSTIYSVLLQYYSSPNIVLRLSTQISANAAPANKSDTPTSPNNALATRSETPT